MKKFLISLAVTLLILAAAAYLIYPTAAQQAAGVRDDRIIRTYHRRIGRMETEEIQSRLDSAAEYNSTLPEFQAADVFTNREVLTLHRYEAPLNTGDGLAGVLTIPGISVTLPVYHESAERKAAEKLVHIQGTALPSDRTGSHTVLAGPGMLKAEGFAEKIGLTGERMLEDVDRLTPGDLMILNVLDRTMVYQIEWVQTMAPEGLAGIDLTAGPDDDLLTLMTERRERRLVVRGRRIPAADAVAALKASDQARPLPDWQSILLLGSPVILLGLIVMAITERIKKRSYRLPAEQAAHELLRDGGAAPAGQKTKPKKRKPAEETETRGAENITQPAEEKKPGTEDKNPEQEQANENEGEVNDEA